MAAPKVSGTKECQRVGFRRRDFPGHPRAGRIVGWDGRFDVSLTPSKASVIVKFGRWSTPFPWLPRYRWPGLFNSSLVKGGFEGS
jgi:hypothetical protein